MLVKKELEGVDLLPMHCTARDCSSTLVAAVIKLPRSGKILFADAYDKKSKRLVARFVSDGKNYLTCEEWPPKCWTQKNPRSLCGFHTVSSDEDEKRVRKFLDPNKDSFAYNAMSAIGYFCAHKGYEKRRKAEDKKRDRFRKHVEMYPALPANLENYCENNLFTHTYIFIEKLDKKGNRYGRCGCCGERYKIPRDAKSGRQTVCERCGRPGRYRAAWIKSDIIDCADICIAAEVDKQLLLRWVNVCRGFPACGIDRYRYAFRDYAYQLYLRNPDGSERIWFYKDINTYAYSGWWIAPAGDTCTDVSFLYTDNLRQIFGEKYYNVDLQQGLQGKNIQLSFPALLTSLKNTPTAEYLFKMGMPLMAEHAPDLGAAAQFGKPSFGRILGIDPGLRTLYTQQNVSLAEHKVIAAYGGWVTAEDLAAYRKLNISPAYQRKAATVMRKMTFHRFTKYFTEQMAAMKEKRPDKAISIYEDYLDMCEALKVDLSHKSVRYPQDLKQAHDLLLPRFTEIKNIVEDELFQTKVKELYANFAQTEWEEGDYLFVLPQKRSQLIVEGQALSHCVGGDHYYKEHLGGVYMICFVRKKDAPKKPFYTLQFHLYEKRIVQLYGYGNRQATPELRKAAQNFINRIAAGRQRKTA